jgi:HAE1 family hydrophobic/amphiphilic exporter-1
VASGAGAVSRWSLGTAIFGGLLVATVMNFLVTPALYVVVKSLVESITGGNHPSEPSDSGEPAPVEEPTYSAVPSDRPKNIPPSQPSNYPIQDDNPA